MGQHDIGDYFKNRIKGYSQDVNTDELWSKLDLDSNDRKKRTPFYLLVFLFIGIAFSTVYFLYISESSDLNASLSEKSVDLTSLPSSTTATTKKIKTEESQSPIYTNTSREADNSPVIEKTTSKTSKILPGLNKETKSNLSQSKFFLERNKLQTETNSLINKSTRSTKENNAIIKKLKATSITPADKIVHLDKINSLVNYLVVNSSEIAIRSNTTLHLIEQVAKSRSPKFSIGLSGGIFLQSRNLDPILDELDDNIQWRNSSERHLEMFTVGVDFKLHLKNSFYTKLGIEYQSLNELFQLQKTSSETFITTNEFPTFSEMEIIREWKNENSHKLYTIPFSVGHDHKFGRWSIGLEGTFLANYSSKFEGKQLNIFNDVVEVTTHKTNTFNAGYRGTINIERQINSNFSIYVNPSFQKYISSFRKSVTGYNQYYSMFGMNVGIRYHL